MIRSLRIQNLATIDDLEINFDEGFSILTGETGVGKSIIIGGILLVLGEKGSKDMIRTGEEEISVEAIFRISQTNALLDTLLQEPVEDLFIQRRISEKKTGKGYVNGTLYPIKTLRDVSHVLVDIYGQNDHVFLQKIEFQLDYLDSFAEAFPLRKKLSLMTQNLKRLVKEKESLEQKERDREQRLDFLEFQINEIEKAQLVPGEEEELRQDRNILKNAEKIRVLVEDAMGITYTKENSISSLLSRLESISDELADYAKEFKETNEAIGQFAITIKEFSNFLIDFKERHSASPENLEFLEDRLSKIEDLKRKYGKTIAEILSHLTRIKKEYAELTTSREKLEDLDEEIGSTFRNYAQNAQKLASLRKNSARGLEKRIEKEIGYLGMKKARFKIAISSSTPEITHIHDLQSTGTENVEFLLSTNPGEDPRPLRKIASGGELSRIMLALKTIGKDTEQGKTLIFDEIDSGIGGKTAEFVAQKLRGLAKENQVICITHLPQIASFAANHYKIEKTVRNNRTFTTVNKLSFDERVEEIARLSAGSHITQAALQNAKEMLYHNLRMNKRDTNG
ncbi:MAG: DNA repair protein RecN [Candidatus Aminicenantes bacterium]|jgi:DNA repair protein RecN (Recombination protein N)